MEFAVAHVPGSIHIARILGLELRLILAGEDPDHVRESQRRLARVGIEKVCGYLDGGVHGWISEGYALGYVPQISVLELLEPREKEQDHVAILDVREPSEVSTGAIEDS